MIAVYAEAIVLNEAKEFSIFLAKQTEILFHKVNQLVHDYRGEITFYITSVY